MGGGWCFTSTVNSLGIVGTGSYSYHNVAGQVCQRRFTSAKRMFFCHYLTTALIDSAEEEEWPHNQIFMKECAGCADRSQPKRHRYRPRYRALCICQYYVYNWTFFFAVSICHSPDQHSNTRERKTEFFKIYGLSLRLTCSDLREQILHCGSYVYKENKSALSNPYMNTQSTVCS